MSNRSVPNPTATIIFDVPAATDAFGGRGHERSARALAESIRQLAARRDGAIGLEGSWGAGKSTVIKLATESLNEGGSIPLFSVFEFDLWTHHSSDFRRAFLEEFVNWSEKKSHISSAEADENRSIIRNRTKSVDTKSFKSYSILGAALVILLPFLPLAYSWVGPAAFGASKSPFILGLTFPEALIRLLFLAACVPLVTLIASVVGHWFMRPIVFGFCASFWRRLSSRGTPAHGPVESPWGATVSRWRSRPKIGELVSSVLAILSKDTKKNTVTESIRDEDPTTVEFYSVFRKILGIVQGRGVRVVFVLDNIDRIPKGDIPTTWSEVRAVFATDDARRASPNSGVVAVVPYDRAYVISAFSDKDEKPVDEEARFAQGDIFNKTFNRILKVAPPLGSHWGAFLEHMIEQAFGKQLFPDERYKLFRLLQLYLQRNKLYATPRLIVGFVNDIGAYWSQWGGVLPVESIALFVIFRSKIETEPDALVSTELADARYLHIVDQPEWRRHVAALAFNVDPAFAEEILLGDRILEALVAEDASSLSDLRVVGGFDRIFQGHFTSAVERLAAEDPKLVSRAATNVEALKLRGALGTLIWKEFARSLTQLSRIGGADLEEIQGLFRIVAMVPASESERVAGVLREKIADRGSESDHDAGFKWALRLVELTETLREATSERDAVGFWEATAVPGNGEFAVGAAYHIEYFERYAFTGLASLPPVAEMHAALNQYIADNTEVFADAEREMDRLLSPLQKVQSLSMIADRLRSTVVDADDAERLVTAFEYIDRAFPRPKSESSAVLQKFVSDGTLLWYAYRDAESSGERVLAAAIFLIVKRLGSAPVSPAADPHPALGPLSEAAVWYQQLLADGDLPVSVRSSLGDLIAGSHLFPVWLKLGIADSSKGQMFREVVTSLIDEGRVNAVDLKFLTSNYTEVASAFSPERAESLLRQVSGLLDAEKLQEVVPDEAILGISGDFIEAVAAVARDAPLFSLIERADAVLLGRTKEQWLATLSKEDELFHLLIARQRSGGPPMPAHTFVEALEDHLLAVASGAQAVSGTSDEWASISHAIRAGSRRAFGSAILVGIGRQGFAATPSEFLERYQAVVDMLPIGSNAAVSINVFLRALAPSDSETVRNYIRAKAEDFKKALGTIDQGDRAAFIDVVDGIESASPNNDRWTKELRNMLGLPHSDQPTKERKRK